MYTKCEMIYKIDCENCFQCIKMNTYEISGGYFSYYWNKWIVLIKWIYQLNWNEIIEKWNEMKWIKNEKRSKEMQMKIDSNHFPYLRRREDQTNEKRYNGTFQIAIFGVKDPLFSSNCISLDLQCISSVLFNWGLFSRFIRGIMS